MEIIGIRNRVVITTRRASLVGLFLVSVAVGSFFSTLAALMVVAPMLQEAVITTAQNSAAIRDAVAQSEAIRSEIEQIRRGYGL